MNEARFSGAEKPPQPPQEPGESGYLEFILNKREQTEEEREYLIKKAFSIPELFDAVDSVGNILVSPREERGERVVYTPDEIKSLLLSLVSLRFGSRGFEERLQRITRTYSLREKAKIMAATGSEEEPYRQFADWAFLHALVPDWRTQLMNVVDNRTWEKRMTLTKAKELIDQAKIVNRARCLPELDERHFLNEIKRKSREVRQERERKQKEIKRRRG